MASCGESPVSGSLSGGILLSGGSRSVLGVLSMSGPEGLDTVDTPLPLIPLGVRGGVRSQGGNQRRVSPPDQKIWRLHAL
eukprot:3923357-Pleurochrysis_carterae.AAC.1